MAKINKVFPSFYNGVSQQSAELMTDTQCKEMTNCVPGLIQGLHKRPPVQFVRDKSPFDEEETVIHTYDRGEDDEEYIFIYTNDLNNPLEIYNKEGHLQIVEWEEENESELKQYLHNGNLKGLTVQDRTWLVNKEVNVEVDMTDARPLQESYDRVAYYWLKRGSGDRYNPYNYAVYLNGTMYAVNPNKPSGDTKDPATGAEDTDWAANDLYNKINGAVLSLYKAEAFTSNLFMEVKEDDVFIGKELVGVVAPSVSGGVYQDLTWSYDSTTGLYSYRFVTTTSEPTTYTIDITIPNTLGFKCEVRGSVLKIYKEDGSDFGFSTWDSWGDQASEGWKGSVNKITDLPREMPFNGVYVEIKGSENNEFTNYYVMWDGDSWVETRQPDLPRGKLKNMPVACDRTGAQGNTSIFTISKLPWSEPKVGNLDNNPDPSFVGYPISDLLFYKNRFGVASTDSIVLTETANYENFYIKTAINVLDTDPIDVSLASNQASKIYYTKPFNNSLYIFTKYGQYEMTHEGYLSPKTVSIDNVTNYPMAIDVEPRVVNNSLFFISTTNNKQQLREYIKNEKLTVEGVDLNISTPTYLEEKITQVLVNGVLGLVLCCTDTNVIYVYNYKDNGQERVQSAWSKWVLLEGLPFLEGSFEYGLLDASLLVICKTTESYLYHNLQLDDLTSNNKQDTSEGGIYPYKSSIVLPDYYPHISKIGTPKDKILLKKISIEGEGSFNASVYRKDYNRTYEKASTLGLRDLDLHVASKVGNVELTIYDNSINDFSISSVIMEGLYSPTSKEVR